MAEPRRDSRPLRRKPAELCIRKAQPQAGRVLHWDDMPKRLALAVQPSGHKSFKLVYSMGGRVRRYHIGDIDSVRLKEARKTAQELPGQIVRGIDRRAEKRSQRMAGTFEELATRYVEEHAKRRNKSMEQADALVRRYLLPKWAKLNAKDVRLTEGLAIFRKIADAGPPPLANQVLAAV